MRPNISGSLRRIALGVMLPTVLTSTGCYRSTMYPGNGYGTPMYGSPMYGNPTPGYGGYQGQGIQTLTPGTYYAPGTAPTYNPNGLNPQADPNASGSSSGSGGQNGAGSSAPPYSPPASDGISKPVPDPSPFYGNEAGGDSSAPQFDPSGQPQTNLQNSGSPSTLSKPAAREEWGDIKTVSGPDGSELEPEEPAPAAEMPEPVPSLEPVEQEAGVEADEEPALLEPPTLEEADAGKP